MLMVYVYLYTDGTCIKQCPDGYYGDADEYVCERCHWSCRTCRDRHSTDCYSCPEPLLFLQHSCLDSCGAGYYARNGTCQHCDHTCEACSGSATHCLSCKDGYFLLGAQCVYTCPEGYYKHNDRHRDHTDHTCQRCHPSCKTCADTGALECTSCFEGFQFRGSKFGFCTSPCLTGYYPVSTPQGANCSTCDHSCMECKGAGPHDCTECHALQRLAPDGRCLHCCGKDQRKDGSPIPRECCHCGDFNDECELGVNFRFVAPKDAEQDSMSMGGLAATLVLLALGVGLTLFLVLWLRSTAPRAPIAFLRGYEKIPPQETPLSPDSSMNFRDGGLKGVDGGGEEEEEDEEEDDIVYMGQDGTMYRKCKYGLLDEHEEEEPEMEYDYETCTLMGSSPNPNKNTEINQQALLNTEINEQTLLNTEIDEQTLLNTESDEQTPLNTQ
ncbi:proprotein convertase subtilisin/kexin type 5-like [Engraulis encrasicolus]|uniref:proprotein convertase subtilisin/kexin type 5-like n=1 Tax=Engraulis encrasicolus TaxID=184585 RepID=UPI002FD232B7